MSFVWLHYFHSEHHNNGLIYIIIYTCIEQSIIDSYALLNKSKRQLQKYGTRVFMWCWFSMGWWVFSVSLSLVLLHTDRVQTGILLVTERQVIKRKTVINALVKEAQAAVSLVLLIMPTTNLFFLMRNGEKSNHSPDWNTVRTILKCLSLVSLG